MAPEMKWPEMYSCSGERNPDQKYYKSLWKKCKSLQSNQFIHAFWVTNGTVLLKAFENGRVHVITHLTDLKELFPENQLLSEED